MVKRCSQVPIEEVSSHLCGGSCLARRKMSQMISAGGKSRVAVRTVLVDSRREIIRVPWWRDGAEGIC